MKRGLIAAVVAGLALLGATPAWAVFPGRNGRIVYESSHGILRTILPSGRGDRKIGFPYSWDAAWSPDGQHLAFTGDITGFGSEPDIYTMRADGTDVRRLTFIGDSGETLFVGSSSYSPGGGRIMFTGAIKGPKFVETMRTDGSDQTSYGSHLGYVWSPGGEITFNKRGDIWEVRPNGSNEHLLVRSGSFPIYSPDGSEFLFRQATNDDSVHYLLADADGQNIRTPACSKTLDRMEYLDSYSPDGQWLLATNVTVGPDARTGSLVRISLRSCKTLRVVGHTTDGSADWQAVPSVSSDR